MAWRGEGTERDRHKTALHTGTHAKTFSVSGQCSAKIKRTHRVMGKDDGGEGGGWPETEIMSVTVRLLCILVFALTHSLRIGKVLATERDSERIGRSGSSFRVSEVHGIN